MKSLATQKMNSQKGFTLIELVVVIVILGILAVTAAPKFINIQDDARTATLQAVKASMQSAAALVHSKSLIAGNEKNASAATEFVTVNTVQTQVNFGYPLADYATAATTNPGNWTNLLEIEADFDTLVIDSKLIVHPKNSPAPSNPIATTDNCYVTYTQAADATTVPTYEVTPCL